MKFLRPDILANMIQVVFNSHLSLDPISKTNHMSLLCFLIDMDQNMSYHNPFSLFIFVMLFFKSPRILSG